MDNHGVDARTDIYSLGCTFYFLLTGHPPFPDGTLPQRLMAHQRMPPPDPRLERKDTPEDLVAILMKMMAKQAADRYQSAREVVDVLADWLRDQGQGLSLTKALWQRCGRICNFPPAARRSCFPSEILPDRGRQSSWGELLHHLVTEVRIGEPGEGLRRDFVWPCPPCDSELATAETLGPAIIAPPYRSSPVARA